jgi:hypothetical protein
VSIYTVDKLLREMIMKPERAVQFLEDRAAYVRDSPLADAERQAFLALDYRSLYGMGAHPFLLWVWTQRVRKPTDVRALIQEYREAVGPLGYPSFGT